MNSQILLFDIGNTSIKVGLAHKDAVLTSYVLRTDAGQTADSLGLYLFTALQHAALHYPDAYNTNLLQSEQTQKNCEHTPMSNFGHVSGPSPHIAACVCSSVVPSMTPLVREACARFVGAPFLQVPQDVPVPLKNCYETPHEVGADRLVGAYAARKLFPTVPSLIVVDFGTATTFDCISGQDYLGGIIFPGVHTAAAALSANAAKLPRIHLATEDTEPVPGRNTASSMQHGILFGFAAMVEGLSARLAKQMQGPVHILGTGGFAQDIARVSTCFHDVMPNLLLDGLRQLYYEDRVKS